MGIVSTSVLVIEEADQDRPSAIWRHAGMRIWLLVIAVTIVSVYWRAFDYPFQYDDIHSIVENPNLTSLTNLPRYFADPTLFSSAPGSAMYRPVLLVSYAINRACGGLNPVGYRWVNLAVHVACALLLATVVAAWTGRYSVGVIAGAVFGLHPINAEAVVYISSRSESLCALFYLLSLWFYARASPDTGKHRSWLLASLAAFACSLLSKSVAVTLPVALMLYDTLVARARPESRLLTEVARRQWPFWAVGAAYLVIIRGMLSNALLAEPVRGYGAHVATQMKAAVYYLKLLAMPTALSVEHGFTVPSVPGPTVTLALLFVLSLALVVICCRGVRRQRFWIIWGAVVLLPASLTPLNVLVNEHRLYLTSAAFSLLTVCLMLTLGDRTRALTWIVAPLLLSLGSLSFQRIGVWETPLSLWRDASRKAPYMPRPHIFIGDHLKLLGDYEEALSEYELALRVYPQHLSGGDLLTISAACCGCWKGGWSRRSHC